MSPASVGASRGFVLARRPPQIERAEGHDARPKFRSAESGRVEQRRRMDRSEFREALLTVMDRKVHWAWPGFTSGLVPRERLHVHLEQEYAVYVRDFPVLVARAYVDCPIAEVRRELAENLYEEETRGIAAGR